jgi:hypothetical protein
MEEEEDEEEEAGGSHEHQRGPANEWWNCTEGVAAKFRVLPTRLHSLRMLLLLNLNWSN